MNREQFLTKLKYFNRQGSELEQQLRSQPQDNLDRAALREQLAFLQYKLDNLKRDVEAPGQAPPDYSHGRSAQCNLLARQQAAAKIEKSA